MQDDIFSYSCVKTMHMALEEGQNQPFGYYTHKLYESLLLVRRVGCMSELLESVNCSYYLNLSCMEAVQDLTSTWFWMGYFVLGCDDNWSLL